MYKIAGVLFFLAGATMLMGIITAEIFYPGEYSISQNMISNLAATRPPNSVIRQPSATIFDYSIFSAGIMTLLGTYFLYKTNKRKYIMIAMSLMGLGTVGVGVFPAFHPDAHPIAAFAAFFGGGVSAIASSRIVNNPFSSLAILFGIVTLTFLFIGVVFPQNIVPLLGVGGTERWVAYPMVLWLTGLGGYLMNYETVKKSK